MNKVCAIIVLVVLSSGIYSQSAEPKKVFEIPKGLLDPATELEAETPARRAEIIFFISLPFTALFSFLLVNGIYFISNPSYSFTLSTLPPEIIPFSVFSALVSSGMISYNDYLEEEKRKKQAIPQTSDINEFKMGLTLKKTF